MYKTWKKNVNIEENQSSPLELKGIIFGLYTVSFITLQVVFNNHNL